MSAIDPQKAAILKELQRRRNELSPDKTAILDELSSRFELSPSATPTPDTFNDDRSAGQVAWDQTKNFAAGIPQAITGIPAAIGGMIGAMGSPAKQWEMVKGAAQPFTAGLRGAGALLAPESVQAPSRQEYESAAQGAGAIVGGMALPEVAGLAKSGARGALRAVTSPEAMQARAAANKAAALKPTTLESRASAQTIAPEMSQRRLATGLRGKTIDANVIKDNVEAGKLVKAVEIRLADEYRPAFETSRQSMLEQVQAAHNGLSENLFPSARAALKRVMAEINTLPEHARVPDIVKLRRSLDKVADEMGAFNQSGSAADRITSKVFRGSADMVRKQLNGLDAELAKANHEYWRSRQARDIVERRELGEVGNVSSGLPGRGSLLDDLIASGVGGSVAGPAGAVVAEGVNLARQSRGFANVKSGMQQSVADFIRTPPTEPAGLLGQGVPRMKASVTSSVRATPATAQPATREIRTGRLLTEGTQLPPPTEPPSGGYNMSVETGAPPINGIDVYGQGYGKAVKLGPNKIDPKLEKAKKLRQQQNK